MKKELVVNMRVVLNHGANVGVVLAIINDSYAPMSITDVAKAVGITYPTAHKCLDILVGDAMIKTDGSKYSKF